MKTVEEHNDKEFLSNKYSVKNYYDFHLYHSNILKFLKDEEILLVYVFCRVILNDKWSIRSFDISETLEQKNT